MSIAKAPDPPTAKKFLQLELPVLSQLQSLKMQIEGLANKFKENQTKILSELDFMNSHLSCIEERKKNSAKQLHASEESLSHVLLSQHMMENLINDLLDLAKLENNTFTLTNEPFDLAKTVYEAFDILLHQANERKIGLRAKIDSKDNLRFIQHLYGDQRRYLQILLNFISNSLKFTDRKGFITVVISVKEI